MPLRLYLPGLGRLCLLLAASLIALAGCGGGSHDSSTPMGGGGTPTPSPFAATQYAYQRQILSADSPDAVGAARFDPSGNFYLLGLRQVQKFKKDGTRVSLSAGTATGGSGLAVSPNGDFYVVYGGNPDAQIEKFKNDGALLLKFGASGSGDGQFRSAFDLALDSIGNVYVTDFFNNRIVKFSPDGVFLAKFGSVDGGFMLGPLGGSGNGQLSHPVSIAIDGSDRLYVTDRGNSRVEVFKSDGSYLAQFGTVGTGDGQFGPGIQNGVTDLPGGPGGIALDGAGNVYVIDPIDHRVEKFKSDGTYLAQFGADGGGFSPYAAQGVGVDAAGSVYLALANRVDVYKPVQ